VAAAKVDAKVLVVAAQVLVLAAVDAEAWPCLLQLQPWLQASPQLQ